MYFAIFFVLRVLYLTLYFRFIRSSLHFHFFFLVIIIDGTRQNIQCARARARVCGVYIAYYMHTCNIMYVYGIFYVMRPYYMRTLRRLKR